MVRADAAGAPVLSSACGAWPGYWTPHPVAPHAGLCLHRTCGRPASVLCQQDIRCLPLFFWKRLRDKCMLIHGAFVRGSHGALVRGTRTLPFRAPSVPFLEVVWFRSRTALTLVAGTRWSLSCGVWRRGPQYYSAPWSELTSA